MSIDLPGYQVMDELGYGAMGRVVLAREVSSDRLVAIKQLHIEASKAARSRLAREGRALADLDNPHVVQFIGLQTVSDHLYLVLEYIDGPPLSAVLATGTPSVPNALAIISQLAAGLSYIHGHGVVHRDVKPSNVLVSSAGTCKLNDFGLVRLLDMASGRPVPMTILTQEGMPIGTAAYMSPEAVVGDSTIDHRADLYALGVISYRLLLGRLPFPESLDLLPMLHAQLNSPVPPPATIDPYFPDSLAAPLLQSLQKDRNARQSSVGDFWRELEAAADAAWPGWPSEADLTTLTVQPDRPTPDHPTVSTVQPSIPLASTLLPVEAVVPEIPLLKRRRRTWGLVLSAGAGVAVSVGLFELISHLRH